MSPPPASAAAPSAEKVWASVLRAAAVAARHGVSSEADLLRAFSAELLRLKMRGAVMLRRDDGRLEIHTSALSQSLQSSLERMTGLAVSGFTFDPAATDMIRRSLEGHEVVFSESNREVIQQLLPRPVRALLPRLLSMLGEQGTISAPLLLENRSIGVLVLTAMWLTADDIPMVAALSDHIAVTLGHVRGRAEMRQALERERLQKEVAEALASTRDLDEILRRVVDLAVQTTGADAGALILLDSAGRLEAPPFLVGLPADPRYHPGPDGVGVIWRAIEARTPISLEDYRRDPQATPAFIQAGVRAYLGLPLIVGDAVIGGMALVGLRPEVRFGPDQMETAQGIARQAAIAVQNARLFEEVRWRAEESQALIRTARSVTSSLDLVTVLGMIAEQARDLLQADASRIHLLDPERNVLKVVVAQDVYPEAWAGLELVPGVGLAGWVMQTGQPLLSNDPSSDPRAVQVPGTPANEPECLLMAPLTVRQRPAGVMVVVRDGQERPFQPRELELLTAFAAQAAVAMENAHLFGQIQSQASRLEAEVNERTRDLALSEARYRALVETSIAGIQQVDRDGRILYVNRALAELLGASPETLVGRNLADLIPPGVDPDPVEGLRQRIAGELPPRAVDEFEVATLSGRRIPMLVGTSLISDDLGHPQGATVLMLDISDRKALEAALRTERDRIRTILENIGDAVFVTDPRGRIEYVNPAWERLNGYSAAEAVGRSANLLNSGSVAGEVFASLWQTVLAGRTWRGELVNRRKDGTTYDVALTATPLTAVDGAILSIVSVLYDISAMKEVERLKSQFVSDVSHELRTPLTNIRLYLDLLRGTVDRTKVERYLDTLSRESDRLANLIDDLLSLSRLDAGAVALEPRPVDINRLLGSLVDDRLALAGQRGLDLTLECDARLPPARGDERLLSQVFTNLLTNAMNYTPQQGQIAVRTHAVNQDGQPWVTAEVADTGPGIPPEELPMIFRRFFRGRASRAAAAPGTGLGLSICQEIIDLHGGRISLVSEGVPGKGTRFTVWLPPAPNG